jgi:hypothetical protein
MTKAVFNKNAFVARNRTYSTEETSKFGAKNWTIRKINQKLPGSFETWCWRRMEKTS